MFKKLLQQREKIQEELLKTPLGYFFETRRMGDAQTLTAVGRVLQNLQLPYPSFSEFLRGDQGALMFSNDYGVVIRMERVTHHDALRDNNPWIVQPVGSFMASKALIEICPGVHSTNDRKLGEILRSELRKTCVDYGDCYEFINGEPAARTDNIGVLPVKTPAFPEGVPVVVDRTGVDILGHNINGIKNALARMETEQDPQETLYAPLRAALRDAWPDKKADAAPKKMKQFWELCRAFREEGKLVAGWNEDRKDIYKLEEARRAAAALDARLRRQTP